jgi:hypothetical protein
MSKKDSFVTAIQAGYTFSGTNIVLGGAMLDAEAIPGLQIKVPLRTMNRHGLIAGATGTGKTKSLQVIAEQLAANGVPVPAHGHQRRPQRHCDARHRQSENHRTRRENRRFLAWTGQYRGVPDLSGEKGARLRATISEFGPVLFSEFWA